MAAGALLPWTVGARSDTARAIVFGQGGYDGANKAPTFSMMAEAYVLERVSLRVGGSYVGNVGEPGREGQFRPDAGLRVDALRQERHGVDLAVLGSYEAQGFNLVSAVTARVAASRTFGDNRIVANLGYGFGLEENEGYGDVRLAALRRVADGLHLGVDTRFRIDLERDQDEPAGESEWEVVSGPLAAYSLGRFVVSANAGLSAMKFRLVGTSRVGAIGAVGLGAVF